MSAALPLAYADRVTISGPVDDVYVDTITVHRWLTALEDSVHELTHTGASPDRRVALESLRAALDAATGATHRAMAQMLAADPFRPRGAR